MLWNAPWNPSGTTDRFQQGAGQVDRLWILDVEGRRLLIDATYVPGSTNHPLVARATTRYPHRVSRPETPRPFGTGCPESQLLRS